MLSILDRKIISSFGCVKVSYLRTLQISVHGTRQTYNLQDYVIAHMSKFLQQKRKQKKYQSNHKGNTIHSSLAMRDMTLENMPNSGHARRISHISQVKSKSCLPGKLCNFCSVHVM
jgi:hypothetical protein